MATKSVRERAQALLTLVETLIESPGMTWVDASNAIFYPRGPFAWLFRTKAERIAFRKTREGQRIKELVRSLPEPPVRSAPKEPYDPTRKIEIIRLARPRDRAKARKRQGVNGRSSDHDAKRPRQKSAEPKKS
jgi:hypothetical protein